MKIRVNFNNTQMKIGYDGKLRFSENKVTQGKPAYFEIDLGFLGSLYNMLPPNMYSPNKAIGPKTPSMESQIYMDAAGITLQMPANGHDVFNYVARYGAANFQIQSIITLNGKLDPEILRKAVRLTLDQEPIFGCRLIENEPPYWKRLSNIDDIQFCSFESTNNIERAVQNFYESPFSMDNDPMVKVHLISSNTHDILCLKINHTCCDGAGVKEYIDLLSDIYSVLEKGGTYDPKPSVRTRKDQDRLFNALGIKDPEAAWNSTLGEIPKMLWAFPWTQGKADVSTVATCNLPQGVVDVMSKYGKAHGASVNDILLAAFYRALFEISQPEFGIPMHISMTVDLRRYLPEQRTEAIRNFSGGVISSIERVPNEPFEGTLSRIAAVTNKIKNDNPGLQSAIGLERVERANFFETLAYYRNAGGKLTYTDEFAAVLSNLGYLNKELFKFGNVFATDAYIVPPAISAPGLLLCVGTYNDKMTFAVSYYKSQASRESIDMLLNLIKNQIIEGCK